MGQTRNLCVEVGVAEECYRLTLRSDDFEVADFLRGRGDDAVEGRTQDIVAPAGQEVRSVYDDCAGLRRERWVMLSGNGAGSRGRGIRSEALARIAPSQGFEPGDHRPREM